MSNILIAFIITLIAGLSTCIGSLFVLVKKNISDRYLSISLAFSAGVMIFVSFNEIFVESKKILVEALGKDNGILLATISFFTGILISAVIDLMVPKIQNPHELSYIHNSCNEETIKNYKLMRMGIMSTIAVMIHNLPEGIATFISSVNDISIGIPIAVAVALHNIPEGIVVSVPIYCATNNRLKAFKYALISGIAEPIGAILSFFVLMPIMNDVVFGFVLGIVSGIMIYISFDELLPAAQEYGDHHTSILALLLGMAVMSISLIIL